MNPVLKKILTTKEVQTDAGEVVPLGLHVGEEEGQILYQLVRELKPKLSVETGMAYGVSTLFMCSAIAENGFGHHVVIDPYQKEHFKDIAVKNVRDAGFADFVEVHHEPSHRVLARMEAEDKKVDFAFVDGSHLFDFALVDFFFIDLMLRVGGVMVVDDTDGPSVEKLARFILTNRSYEIIKGLPVIEPLQYTPTLPHRLVHWIASKSPSLAAKMKPEFMVPGLKMGIEGRCTAFRKLRDDDRSYVPRDMVPF